MVGPPNFFFKKPTGAFPWDERHLHCFGELVDTAQDRLTECRYKESVCHDIFLVSGMLIFLGPFALNPIRRDIVLAHDDVLSALKRDLVT